MNLEEMSKSPTKRKNEFSDTDEPCNKIPKLEDTTQLLDVPSTSNKVDETTDKVIDHASLIANHYNAIEEKGLSHRSRSHIIYIRNFNNWIKSMLIMRYTRKLEGYSDRSRSRRSKSKRSKYKHNRRSSPPRIRVLDLCCGKGGDLLKWQKTNIYHVICADIAEVSVKQCEDRYKSLRYKKHSSCFKAEFLTHDCTKVHLCELFKDPNIPLDLVSCQFALHYAFESLSQAEGILENASRNLKPGGFFIGTIPNAKELLARWNKSESNKFGNRIYHVDFLCDKSNPSLFGAKYNFYLEGVVDCPEFLVDLPTLKELASKFDLDLILFEGFEDFYEKMKRDGNRLLRRMQILYPPYYKTSRHRKVKKFTWSEWDVITLYSVFAFKKLKNRDTDKDESFDELPNKKDFIQPLIGSKDSYKSESCNKIPCNTENYIQPSNENISEHNNADEESCIENPKSECITLPLVEERQNNGNFEDESCTKPPSSDDTKKTFAEDQTNDMNVSRSESCYKYLENLIESDSKSHDKDESCIKFLSSDDSIKPLVGEQTKPVNNVEEDSRIKLPSSDNSIEPSVDEQTKHVNNREDESYNKHLKTDGFLQVLEQNNITFVDSIESSLGKQTKVINNEEDESCDKHPRTKNSFQFLVKESHSKSNEEDESCNKFPSSDNSIEPFIDELTKNVNNGEDEFSNKHLSTKFLVKEHHSKSNEEDESCINFPSSDNSIEPLVGEQTKPVNNGEDESHIKLPGSDRSIEVPLVGEQTKPINNVEEDSRIELPGSDSSIEPFVDEQRKDVNSGRDEFSNKHP